MCLWLWLLSVVLGVLALVVGLVLYQPRWLLERLMRLDPRVVWSFDTTEKIVALTIDDSPTPVTDELLDCLEQNNAHATFFVIGSYMRPSLGHVVRRLLRMGCELGNHTWDNRMSALLSQDEFERSYQDTHSAIRSAEQAAEPPLPGTGPRWFRPGCGFFRARMIDYVANLAHRPVLGSLYPYDAELRSSIFAASHILHHLHPGGIIALHDRSYTLATLRLLLPELAKRGYTVLSLSEMDARCRQ